ncbi:MAG TPA: DUF2388 domain-containing protein [Pseudomonas sp.]
MRLLPLLLLTPLVTLLWTIPAQALDTTTQSLVVSGYATSQVTTGPFDNKLMLAAQDDAAVFIATDGQLRGAQLESALMYLRQTRPKLDASDLELAQAILVQ